MNEIIHNNDALFRKAYKNFREEPSSEVWDNLSARLDKKDAIYYRLRFAWWKNVAVVLILLPGSLIAYELLVSKTTNNNTNAAGKNALKKNGPGKVTDKQQNSSVTNSIKTM
jgi:hypothetical protein